MTAAAKIGVGCAGALLAALPMLLMFVGCAALLGGGGDSSAPGSRQEPTGASDGDQPGVVPSSSALTVVRTIGSLRRVGSAGPGWGWGHGSPFLPEAVCTLQKTCVCIANTPQSKVLAYSMMFTGVDSVNDRVAALDRLHGSPTAVPHTATH